MKPHYEYKHKSRTSSMNANVASLLVSRKTYASQYFDKFECILNI